MDPERTCVTRGFARSWKKNTNNTKKMRKFWKDLAHHRRRRAVAHNLHHLEDERREVVARPITGWDVW